MSLFKTIGCKLYLTIIFNKKNCELISFHYYELVEAATLYAFKSN